MGAELEDPEDANKPESRSKVKARSKAKVKKQPAKAVIARRVSMNSSAGQSPHHGLQDDTWGTEGGSSYREETPMTSDLEADFPEPEVQRQVKGTVDADFCRDREVLVLTEPEEPAAEGDVDFCRDREVLVLPLKILVRGRDKSDEGTSRKTQN